MRSINKTRFNAGRIYGVFAAFACLVAANAAVVEPKATDEILCNPGMGFFHFCYSGRLWAYGGELKPGDTLDWMPGTTVTYMRLPWSYLEPEEGVYRWDLFEAKARPWLAAGKKLGFRISCMNISIASTPQWVLDAGAKGVWRDYSNTGTKSMVWEPVWDDPVYLGKYETFLKAFAERYDGAKDLSVELFYLDGECYYNQRYMNEFYNLEDNNNRIYGGPLDAAELSRRLEKASEVIRQNIDDLRDQMAGFGEALAKYNSIYEELKKLEPYRSAMKHCTEREFEFARRLADVYVGL